jgi:hypothetical protein
VQLLPNERLLRRESRIGGLFLGITFAVLAAGLLLSFEAERWASLFSGWLPDANWAPIIATYGIVILGMVLYYLGNARIRRYGAQYRQDGRLRQLLRGLDDRYALYTFLGRKLPDYVLIGPSGLFVITPRAQQGEIVCRDDRWSVQTGPLRRIFTVLYGNPIGNPSYDTQLGIHRIGSLLTEKLGEATAELVPPQGLIVFTGERVRLRIERSSFPVTTGREVRRVITRTRNRLSATQLAKVREALEQVRTS